MLSRIPTFHLTIMALLWAGPQATAQPAARPVKPVKPKSIFGEVVPQVTGRNGYEELVLAADLFASSPVYEEAQKLEAPLEVKRRVLKDRQVVRALSMIQAAVDKPVFGPRIRLTFSTTLPELQQFRSLARLLAVNQYVLLADGRVTDAISIGRLGLRFADAVQQDTLIHGLVGLAISRVVMSPLVKQLDQLGARDCESVYRLALDALSAPSPQGRIFAGEARWTREGLREIGEELKKKGPAALSSVFSAEDETDQTRSLRAAIPADPAAIDRVIAQAELRVDEHYLRIARELTRPSWERAFPSPPQGSDPSSLLAGALLPSYSQGSAAYTRELARMRLLACEVAVRRYRWEHNALPASLEVLRLGELALDPFTGQLLEYTTAGRKFTLRSLGAPNGDGGQLPISLGS